MQLQLSAELIYALVLFGLAFLHLVAAIGLGQISVKRKEMNAGWGIGCVVVTIGTLLYGALFARTLYNIGEKFFGH